MKKAVLQKFGLLGVVSLLSYTAAVVFSLLAYPGYNPMAQAVSDLSAANTPSLSLWNRLRAFYNVCEAVFSRPFSPGHITFVLDETIITEELITEIYDALTGHGKRFMRTAFVGADVHSCKKLKRLLYGHGFAIGFFDGIEPAKEWIVDEQRI